MKSLSVNLADISIGKTNPRKIFHEKEIQELGESIKKNTLIQPITVRPIKGKAGKYELVCGEKRLRAHKLIKAIQIDCIIKELTDEQVIEYQIIENLMRSDIHAMEEAVAFKNLCAVRKIDYNEIAKLIGKSHIYVFQRLKLNDLSPEFQQAFYDNRMTLTIAMRLCRMPNASQKQLWNEMKFKDLEGNLEINDGVFKKYLGNLKDAPFDIADKKLVESAGACTNCQYNSAASTSLFPDAEKKAICTNLPCFTNKCSVNYSKGLEHALMDPTIELIGNYQPGQKAQELMKAGHTVYKEYDSRITKMNKPEPPELETYLDDIDDTDEGFGEYKNKAEAQKAYNKDLKQYDQDIIEFNKAISSGKYIKAFIVEGNNAGGYEYIKINKEKADKSSSSGKTPSAKESAEAEIKRLQEKEKRNQELDAEKIRPLYEKLMNESKTYVSPKQLTHLESKIALFRMFGYIDMEAADRFLEYIGAAKHGRGGDLDDLIAFAKGKPITKIHEWFTILIKMEFQYSGFKHLSGNNYDPFLIELLQEHDPKGISALQAEQKKVVDARQARMNEKIKNLRAEGKKAETEKPAAKKEAPAAKKPAPAAKKPIKKK
jgi:ParB/RepB/Spo0J family partition protein